MRVGRRTTGDPGAGGEEGAAAIRAAAARVREEAAAPTGAGSSCAGSTHAGSTSAGSTHAGSTTAGSTTSFAGVVGGGHGCMEGLPDGLAGSAVLALVLLSTVLVTRPPRPGRTRGPRFDVLTLPGVRRLVKWRGFQPLLQALPLTLFLAVVYAGLEGTPVPERNLATVLTWGIWWVLLIVDIVLLGRMWCMVCPWEAIAGALRRLAVLRRSDEPLALDRPWPRWLRNVYPATVLFVGLTWLELGYGVTFSPRATALMGLGMLAMAVVPALLYEKRAFCKYGCLVGRICGLYSLLAPVEVRATDPQACVDCKTKDCVFGNELAYPCPTSQYPAKMETSAYCTVCTECVKACPKDNVAWNVRPWGEDLRTLRKPRKDEALLALVMLAMTSFHGLTMTPSWNAFLAGLRDHLDLGPLTGFSLGMAGALLLPILLFLAFAWPAARLATTPGERRNLLRSLAYPMVAVALFYHLAHNAGHFLWEGGRIVPVLSDPMGRGWDLFGTAGWTMTALTSMGWIWRIQILMVVLGHWMATAATLRFVGRATPGPAPRTGAALAAAGVLAFSLLNLWLLAQPMEMRTGL